MQERILVVGAADMELLLNVNTLPRAGESSIEENRFGYAAGGGAAVSALALSRLGAAPILSARVGSDNHGGRLLNLYREAGLDPRFIAQDHRAATGMRVAVREASGDCRTVYYPGANRNLLLSDVENAVVAGAPEALCLQMELPTELLLGVSRLAASYGLPLLVDAAGIDPDFPLSSLARAEIFCADDRETYAITGTYPVGSDSCLKAAVELEKHVRARYYLIKLGERGVFLYDGRYCHVVTNYGVRMPEGAPLCDSLCAAILLEYLRNGRDILGACRFGLALNALLVKNGNDATYFPHTEEIRDFAARH